MPIKPAVLNRLGHMGSTDRRHPRKVGNGARHLEYAMVGARGKSQPADRLLEQCFALFVGHAVFVDVACGQQDVGFALPRQRALACGCGARTHGCRWFTLSLTRHVFLRQRRHFNLQIDAIQQRP